MIFFLAPNFEKNAAFLLPLLSQIAIAMMSNLIKFYELAKTN